MKISDLAQESLSAIFANRARSLLTLLGIVIGIGSVIAMTALIGGATQSMMGGMGLSQSRLIRIDGWSARGGLTEADIEQIKENVEGYDLVTGFTYASGTITNGTKQEKNGSFTCAYAEYLRASGIKLTCGRFYTDAEDRGCAQVVVLNRDTATKLFSSEEAALGKTITFQGNEYTVVGVCEPTNAYDTQSYMPLPTAMRRIFGGNAENASLSVVGYATDENIVEEVAANTKTFLAGYLNVDPDDETGESYLYVYTNKEAIAEIQRVMSTFELMMVSVAGVSLLVGGIGIMNMMLTNVTERIREIGLRKALGARASDITKQFLFESVLICLVGGALGVLLGYGGAWALSGIAGQFFSSLGADAGFAPIVSLSSVGVASGVCIAIGLVFGYYPARRAAKLNPVESLRFQ
jgi:putative ABC transport system permease protein